MRQNVLGLLDKSCSNSLKIALALEQEIKDIMKVRSKIMALREKAARQRVYRVDLWNLEAAIDNILNRSVFDN